MLEVSLWSKETEEKNMLLRQNLIFPSSKGWNLNPETSNNTDRDIM